MTPNIHAAHELIERELEQLAETLPDHETLVVMETLPVYVMLTLALDLLNKAIAFDHDTTTTHPHQTEGR